MRAYIFATGPAATDLPFSQGLFQTLPRRRQPSAALDRARQALHRADHEGALVAFEEVIREAGPDAPAAHLGRAFCLAQLGRDEDALFALQDASDSTNLAEVPLRLAAACVLAGQPAEALRLVAVALDAEPALAPKVADDERFAALRDHPAFLQLVGRL